MVNRLPWNPEFLGIPRPCYRICYTWLGLPNSKWPVDPLFKRSGERFATLTGFEPMLLV